MRDFDMMDALGDCYGGIVGKDKVCGGKCDIDESEKYKFTSLIKVGG